MECKGRKVCIIGSGAWGCTLGWLLSNNFEQVVLWGRDTSDRFKVLKESRTIYKDEKREIKLGANVRLSSDIGESIFGSDVIMLVVSTNALREVCERIKLIAVSLEDKILVNTSKGLEQGSGKRMSEVMVEVFGMKENIAILSGPTLAKEIQMGCPTAACISGFSMVTVEKIQSMLNVASKFRLYTNDDIVGVELGGSLKNIMAIASGLVDGMGLGDNAKGALLTRGMAEIVRVSTKLGANPSTLYGLSGFGDMIATCSSPLSRNYRVGLMLSENKKIDEITKSLKEVAEGIKTTKVLCEIAQNLNVQVPISQAIYQALYSNINPADIINTLMNRQLKAEEKY